MRKLRKGQMLYVLEFLRIPALWDDGDGAIGSLPAFTNRRKAEKAAKRHGVSIIEFEVNSGQVKGDQL